MAHDPNELPTTLDPQSLRRAYSMFPSGVTAVCAIIDGQPVGMAASSFTSVSLDPPLVSVCIALTSSTWPILRTAHRLGVSVLGERHGQVARQLAARGGDRFAGVAYEVNQGAVLVPDAAMWAVCSLDQEFTAGDHVIAVLRVYSADPHPEIRPIIFHASDFHQLAV